MPTMIEATISGHQYHQTVEGELIQYCTTVEHFNEGRDRMQVPAVVVRLAGGAIKTIALAQDRYQVSLREIECQAATVTAKMSREGARIDLGKYAGTYGGTVDPEPAKPAGLLRKILAALTGKAPT